MKVEVGDLIFSHVEGRIVAVSTPLRVPYRAPAPDARDVAWAPTGFRADVEFRVIERPVPFEAAYQAIRDFPEGTESPFSAAGRPNQGYLFKLSDAAGVRLSELVCGDDEPQLGLTPQQQAPNPAPPPANTSAQATITVRLGQALFRRRLDHHWQNCCAITGLNVRDLLRASHIKRWSDSNNQERLDVFNGLLLSAAYDAAFDRGLISFKDDGSVILSKALIGECGRQAGIDSQAKIGGLDAAHRLYLAYHRRHYFLG
jgi:hypothetical protein